MTEVFLLWIVPYCLWHAWLPKDTRGSLYWDVSSLWLSEFSEMVNGLSLMYCDGFVCLLPGTHFAPFAHCCILIFLEISAFYLSFCKSEHTQTQTSTYSHWFSGYYLLYLWALTSFFPFFSIFVSDPVTSMTVLKFTDTFLCYSSTLWFFFPQNSFIVFSSSRNSFLPFSLPPPFSPHSLPPSLPLSLLPPPSLPSPSLLPLKQSSQGCLSDTDLKLIFWSCYQII